MTPKIFSNGKQDYTDIVHIFRLFTSHRPDSMKNEDSPFYLTPIQENKLSKTKMYGITQHQWALTPLVP